MNVYEVLNNYEEKMELIFQNVNPETGEIIEDEAIKEELIKELKVELNNKNESLVKYIKNLESNIESIKNEEKRLSDKRKARENQLSRFKEFIVFSLESIGKKAVDTTLAKISIRESEAVVVDDLTKLNQEYIKVKETISADKTKIKESIKKGLNVEGAYIQKNKSLSVR